MGRTDKTGKAAKARTSLSRGANPLTVVLRCCWLTLLPVFPVFPVLPALSAQTRAGGRVLDADSTPVAGIRVILHRVGSDTQGPIDSTRSDERGRFRFSFHPDTSALYLVSGRYAGIEYFSAPVPTNPSRPDTALTVVVYDTSTTAPVSVEARHLVVTRPDQDGARGVLDLVVLKNGGRRTRIAPDTTRPSWSLPLPEGTQGLAVGESDISSQAVIRRGDSLLISAAIAPGEKQLTLQYQIPTARNSIALAVSDSGTTFNVLTEESGATVRGPGLRLADSQIIQGRSFRRWTGTVPRSAIIQVILPGRPSPPRWLLLSLVLALALGLAGSGWYVAAHRTARPMVRPVNVLIADIAALDARYSGREQETPADEWRAYHADRARLKAELEASLAARGWTP